MHRAVQGSNKLARRSVLVRPKAWGPEAVLCPFGAPVVAHGHAKATVAKLCEASRDTEQDVGTQPIAMGECTAAGMAC